MKLSISQICLATLLLLAPMGAQAQKSKQKKQVTDVPAIASADSAKIAIDSMLTAQDSSKLASLTQPAKPVRKKRNWATWRPDTKRAMWLALVLPGAGQIYNHKYWKLPFIYGGFVGCTYAITYMDIMDDDPNTQSYNQFLHLGAQINESNIERYKEIFRKRKDKYRRWRDLGTFVMIGIYAFSVIDAYVDASLSEFDISDDLSLRIEPTMLNNGNKTANPLRSGSLGVSCSLTF